MIFRRSEKERDVQLEHAKQKAEELDSRADHNNDELQKKVVNDPWAMEILKSIHG